MICSNYGNAFLFLLRTIYINKKYPSVSALMSGMDSFVLTLEYSVFLTLICQFC
jgi:hypothetical protein